MSAYLIFISHSPLRNHLIISYPGHKSTVYSFYQNNKSFHIRHCMKPEKKIGTFMERKVVLQTTISKYHCKIVIYINVFPKFFSFCRSDRSSGQELSSCPEERSE